MNELQEKRQIVEDMKFAVDTMFHLYGTLAFLSVGELKNAHNNILALIKKMIEMSEEEHITR